MVAAYTVSCLIGPAQRDDGQDMAEYGILIAVIAIIAIVGATVLGGSISALVASTASSV
jgi:Flp pilus assembly pilin Flp